MYRSLEEGIELQIKPTKQTLILKTVFFSLILILLLVILSTLIALSTLPNSEPSRMIQNNSKIISTNLLKVTFFQLTDLHLDPFYNGNYNSTNNCHAPTNSTNNQSTLNGRSTATNSTTNPYGQYGCDSPELLLNATFQSIINANMAPSFILVTGDFASHDMPTQSAWELAMSRSTDLLSAYFPRTQVYPLIGNNDVYPHYRFVVNQPTPYLNNITQLWSRWLNLTQQETMRQGGYYSADIGKGIRLIALNTVLYSSELINSYNLTDEKPTPANQLPLDPNGQFKWLVEQLDEVVSFGEKAILAMHISPGTNSYDPIPLWHAKYLVQFDSLIAKYKDVILTQLAGHFHSDEFRLIWADKKKSPVGSVLLAPSVSPVYTNNPTFRLFELGYQSIANYVQYYTDLPRTNANNKSNFTVEYDFITAYNEIGVNTTSLWSLFNKLKQSTETFLKFLVYIKASYAPKRVALLCATIDQATGNYLECLDTYSDDDGDL